MVLTGLRPCGSISLSYLFPSRIGLLRYFIEQLACIASHGQATEDEGKPPARWRYLVLVLDLLFSTACVHGRGNPVQGLRRGEAQERVGHLHLAHSSSGTRQQHGHAGRGRGAPVQPLQGDGGGRGAAGGGQAGALACV